MENPNPYSPGQMHQSQTPPKKPDQLGGLGMLLLKHFGIYVASLIGSHLVASVMVSQNSDFFFIFLCLPALVLFVQLVVLGVGIAARRAEVQPSLIAGLALLLIGIPICFGSGMLIFIFAVSYHG